VSRPCSRAVRLTFQSLHLARERLRAERSSSELSVFQLIRILRFDDCCCGRHGSAFRLMPVVERIVGPCQQAVRRGCHRIPVAAVRRRLPCATDFVILIRVDSASAIDH